MNSPEDSIRSLEAFSERMGSYVRWSESNVLTILQPGSFPSSLDGRLVPLLAVHVWLPIFVL